MCIQCAQGIHCDADRQAVSLDVGYIDMLKISSCLYYSLGGKVVEKWILVVNYWLDRCWT